jgi:hypothetical protein
MTSPIRTAKDALVSRLSRPKSSPVVRQSVKAQDSPGQPTVIVPPRHAVVPHVQATVAWAESRNVHAYGTGPVEVVVVPPKKERPRVWQRGKQYKCPYCGSPSTFVDEAAFKRGY